MIETYWCRIFCWQELTLFGSQQTWLCQQCFVNYLSVLQRSDEALCAYQVSQINTKVEYCYCCSQWNENEKISHKSTILWCLTIECSTFFDYIFLYLPGQTLWRICYRSDNENDKIYDSSSILFSKLHTSWICLCISVLFSKLFLTALLRATCSTWS